MGVEIDNGLNGNSSDSSTIPKSTANPDEIELATRPGATDKEHVPVEYIQGPRFRFICAS